MKNIWKKSFAVVVAALCVFSAVACGKGASDDDDEDWEPGASHTHIYNPYMTKKQPTCTQKGENLLKCSCGKTRTEEVGRIAHDMSDGVCGSCGAEESKGLRLVLADGGDYYRVAGLGSCTDTDIIIPMEKNGKPVVEIDAYALAASMDKDCEKITSVNIPETITRIGTAAFDKCINLSGFMVDKNNYEYCAIREDLYTKDEETIVRYAIGKENTSFEFPKTVTKIGQTAFCSANALKSIVIPEGITEIGERAFAMCEALESVTISASVKSIGGMQFNACGALTSIVVDSKNTEYQSIDGNLYTKDGTSLLQYAIGKTEETFIVPDGVQIIAATAFSKNIALKRVELPASLTEIQAQAFYSVKVSALVYAGKKAEWNKITKGLQWKDELLATSVECEDGMVKI